MKKKFLAWVMTFAMVLSLVPAVSIPAFAVSEGWTEFGTCEYKFDEESGTMTIRPLGNGESGTLPENASIKALIPEQEEEPEGPTVTTVKIEGNVKAGQSLSGMFRNLRKLEKIEGLENLDTSAVTDMSDMFCFCSSLKSLDVSKFDTTAVTNMYSMFCSCSSLKSLDVSKFNTSAVTDMSDMFFSCSSLESLDVSNFDTTAVTSMFYMFYDCSSLKNLDVSNFDTTAVTSMDSMFNGCSSLGSLDVSNFSTPAVTNMSAMFYRCSSLGNLDLSKFDTSKVTTMDSMFYRCSSLGNLDLSKFDTSKVTIMKSMFDGCSKLTTILVSDTWDTERVSSYSNMFAGCTALKGENGTTINTAPSNLIDKTYARIDIEGTPGYLTGRYSLTSAVIGLPEGETGEVTFTMDGVAATAAAEKNEVKVVAMPVKGYDVTLSGVYGKGNSKLTINSDGTFTMPAGNVTVTATYTHTHSFTYAANEEDKSIVATCGNEGCGLTDNKISLTLNENCTLDEADAWEAAGLTVPPVVYSENTASITVNNFTVTRTFAVDAAHKVTVLCGTADNTTNVKPGEIVKVTAGNYTDKVFDTWTSDASGMIFTAGNTTGTATFTMPNTDVEITANYLNCYPLVVTGNGTTTSQPEVEKDSVTVTAPDAPKGQEFTGWTSSDVNLTEEQQTETPLTITMPSHKTTLTANYATIYSITQNSCTAKIGGTAVTQSIPGKKVELTAADRTDENLRFDGWTIEGVTGLAENASKTSPLTFTMPEGNVTATANYVNLYAVTVTNGTSSVAQAAEGDSVIITAEDKSSLSQRFKNWTAINMILSDSQDTAKNPLTIQMPGQAVSFTANYVRQVAIPTASTQTFTYNGTEQTYTLNNTSDSDYYTVTGNKRTIAGEQTVTVSLKDKDNTEWADGTTNDLTFTFTIEKMPVNAPSTGGDWTGTYDGGVWDAILCNINSYCTVKDSAGKALTTATDTAYTLKGTNAGSYTVYAALNDPDNTKWKDSNTSDNKSYTLTIERASVQKPLADSRTFTYTGKDQTYYAYYEINGKAYDFNGVYYDVNGNVQSAIGTHTVTVTPRSNYKWEDGTTDTLYYDFTIEKKLNGKIYYLRKNGTNSLVAGYDYGSYFQDEENHSNLFVKTFYTPYLYNVPSGTTAEYYVKVNEQDAKVNEQEKSWDTLKFKDLQPGTYQVYAELSCPGYEDATTNICEFTVYPAPIICASNRDSTEIVTSVKSNFWKLETYETVYHTQITYHTRCFSSAAAAVNWMYDEMKNDSRITYEYFECGNTKTTIKSGNYQKLLDIYSQLMKQTKANTLAPSALPTLFLMGDGGNTRGLDISAALSEDNQINDETFMAEAGLLTVEEQSVSSEAELQQFQEAVTEVGQLVTDSDKCTVTYDYGYFEDGVVPSGDEVLTNDSKGYVKETEQVTLGSKITKEPTRVGYVFEGWYTGKATIVPDDTPESEVDTGREWDWDTDAVAWDMDNDRIFSDTTLYARWSVASESEGGDWTAPTITGVEEDKTYSDAVTIQVSDNTTVAQLLRVWDNDTYLSANAEGKYTIAADGGTHIVTAKDMNGNTATVTIKTYSHHSNSGTSTTVPVTDDGSNVKVTATVKNTNATISNITAAQIEKVDADSNVTVDLTTLGKTIESVTLPKTTLENVVDSETNGLEVKLSTATVTLDKTALEAIAEQAAGNSIQLVADQGEKAEQSMTDAQKEAVAELNDPVALDVCFVSNGKEIDNLKDGEVKITASVPTTDSVRVWSVAEDGTKTLVPSTSDGTTVTFAMTDGSLYVIEELKEEQTAKRFVDVKDTDYFNNPVDWAAEKGITTGKDDTHFAPADPCTRAQIVTFLWRAAGSPAPETETCPFTDVDSSAYYSDAVLWAVETGITKGMKDTIFGVDNTCTRGQAVTFLHRYEGSKTASAENPFDDVQNSDFFCDAVLWANENNITNGTGANAFSPTKDCTRGQIVTFLYRDMAE